MIGFAARRIVIWSHDGTLFERATLSNGMQDVGDMTAKQQQSLVAARRQLVVDVGAVLQCRRQVRDRSRG